jgi:uncharacterized protein YndB with AHSA1/START domain
MAGTRREFMLHLVRELPKPRPLIFGMHTEPRQLARWWGPNGFTVPSLTLDLRVGGAYRIEMQPPEGARFFLAGEFLRIDPPAHLSYTFRWEDPNPDDQETNVTLSLADLGDSTEVTLDQGPFLTEARLALHTQGWTEGLDRLYEVVARDVDSQTRST